MCDADSPILSASCCSGPWSPGDNSMSGSSSIGSTGAQPLRRRKAREIGKGSKIAAHSFIPAGVDSGRGKRTATSHDGACLLA